MGTEPTDPRLRDEAVFAQLVSANAARKARMLKGRRGVWFGLGMSGLIGWSVAIPTFVGAMAGLWWDRRHPGRHSWTLLLMTIGLVIGCTNAWHWIVQEDRSMSDKPESEHDE